MPRTALAVAACAALLAACASKEPAAPASPPPQQELPPIKVEEASPRTKAELRTELAAGYYERGQMEVALEELAAAEKFDPTYPKIYNVYGLVYTMIGEPAKAEASFRKALGMAPNDSELHQNFGAFLCTHGRARESIGEFEAAIRNPLYRTPEIALINAGKCSVALGDRAAADGYFRRALTVSPGNPVAAFNLGLLSYRTGKYGDARAQMRVVMQQSNPSAEVLALGACVEKRLGDRAAEQSYEAQLRNRFPDAPETRAVAAGECP